MSFDRLFAEVVIRCLPVHEVGVHVLRSANMRLQNEELVKTKFTGPYLRTEEGLASYAEEVTGTSSTELQRDYAGRVVAIALMLGGNTFRQTFESLKDAGFEDEQAWNLCARTYRGGGFTRDSVYLGGYRQVKEYVQKGGDVKILYIGKVGLHHADNIEDMLEDGRLVYPEYLPDFFV